MAGRSDYKSTVLQYLITHPNIEILRESLENELKISKSRLSEVIKELKADGYDIVTPPRSGKLILNMDIKEETAPIAITAISNADLRQWIIIYLLSKHNGMTIQELYSAFMGFLDPEFSQLELNLSDEDGKAHHDDLSLTNAMKAAIQDSFDIDVSDFGKNFLASSVIRKDLYTLRDENIVRLEASTNFKYYLASNLTRLFSCPADGLYEFCMNFEEAQTAISGLEPLKNTYKKAKVLLDMEDSNTASKHFGRSNNISSDQMESFMHFTAYPYKTHHLRIKTKDVEPVAFALGLLFYSVETSSFYALGRNIDMERIELRRIDIIEAIEVLPEANEEYNSSSYHEIYQEMFAAHYDEAYDVKVVFKDFGNIKNRFDSLRKLRPQANIYRIENPPADCDFHYVYQDRIRGLSDFAKFIRRFGSSALVLEPKELRNTMIGTYSRILNDEEDIW